jgi:hypothetical protein
VSLVALSVVELLQGIGLAVVGFVVVVLVCAGILAVLHVVLPSTDAGAEAVDRVNELRGEADAEPTDGLIDTEVDA